MLRRTHEASALLPLKTNTYSIIISKIDIIQIERHIVVDVD
jgi:hypothetical protein